MPPWNARWPCSTARQSKALVPTDTAVAATLAREAVLNISGSNAQGSGWQCSTEDTTAAVAGTRPALEADIRAASNKPSPAAVDEKRGDAKSEYVYEYTHEEEDADAQQSRESIPVAVSRAADAGNCSNQVDIDLSTSPFTFPSNSEEGLRDFEVA